MRITAEYIVPGATTIGPRGYYPLFLRGLLDLLLLVQVGPLEQSVKRGRASLGNKSAIGKKTEMEEIRIYPDPILKKKAQPIGNIDGKVKDIVDRMVEVMYANKGIGLAAPQIGILSQIIIVGFENTWKALINPEIVEGDGESILEEGCLSLPNIEVPVKRKEKVLIRGWNLDGNELHLELSNFPSRVYQHEIDHLNGILIIHHISRLKRELLIKKMLKDIKRSRGKGSIL